MMDAENKINDDKARTKSKDDLLKEFNKFLESKKIRELYNENFVNWRGFLKEDKKIYISDYIAKLFIENILDGNTAISNDEFHSLFEKKIDFKHKRIKPIIQKRNESRDIPNTNRIEERIVLEMFADKKKYIEKIGDIISYQIPLKRENNDNTKGVGKIDFISYKNNCLYLVEIKKDKATDTLIRCILEIATYEQLLNKELILKELSENYKINVKQNKVKKMIVIFEDSIAYKQLQSLDQNLNLKKLIEKFEIEIVILKGELDLNICDINIFNI